MDQQSPLPPIPGCSLRCLTSLPVPSSAAESLPSPTDHHTSKAQKPKVIEGVGLAPLKVLPLRIRVFPPVFSPGCLLSGWAHTGGCVFLLNGSNYPHPFWDSGILLLGPFPTPMDSSLSLPPTLSLSHLLPSPLFHLPAE